MRKDFRRRLLAGQPLLGSWLQVPFAASAEILARVGFDWLAVDAEHGLMDLRDLAALLAACEARDVAGFVRLPAADDIWIRRALDAGAAGLIVPMVNSAEIARHAVAWAKYPPRGKRGFGFSRANGYGADFDAYVRRANRDICVIAQIEHVDGVREVEAILDVDGIDGALIGPYDLSGSMGLVGQPSHPKVLAAARHVLKACRERGKAPGFHVVSADPKSALPYLRQGYRFVALGMDTLFLRSGADAVLRSARAAT